MIVKTAQLLKNRFLIITEVFFIKLSLKILSYLSFIHSFICGEYYLAYYTDNTFEYQLISCIILNFVSLVLSGFFTLIIHKPVFTRQVLNHATLWEERITNAWIAKMTQTKKKKRTR